MSQSMEEDPLRDAAILTRAVENVFRKLIRLLIGRITLTKIQQMIRLVFVDEAQAAYKREQPEKSMPLTKLALLTGLDTRTLNKIIDEQKKGEFLHHNQKFLREITPEGSILDYWTNNLAYQNKSTLAPLVLDLKGEAPSFESLVAETVLSRGVTLGSLLEKLIFSKSVSYDPEKEKVMLLNSTYMPFEFSKSTRQLEIGLATVGVLITTLVHNFETKDHKNDAFFQRANWSLRVNKRHALELRKKIRRLLTDAEYSTNEILQEYEEGAFTDNQITAGVGLFYFEDQSIIE